MKNFYIKFYFNIISLLIHFEGCTIKRFWHLLSKKCKEENENFPGNYYIFKLKYCIFRITIKFINFYIYFI